MTPYLTRLAIDASYMSIRRGAWYTAAYTRMRELPPLRDIHKNGKHQPVVDLSSVAVKVRSRLGVSDA